MRAPLGLYLVFVLATRMLAQSDPALRDAAAARIAAAVAGNAQGWGKYTTDDFVGIATDGSVMTKQQRMGEIGGHPTANSRGPGMENLQWRLYDRGAAIETYRVMDGGKPVYITLVWVREQGTWKVASAQGTVIASAP
jgi:hypothetical protein